MLNSNFLNSILPNPVEEISVDDESGYSLVDENGSDVDLGPVVDSINGVVDEIYSDVVIGPVEDSKKG